MGEHGNPTNHDGVHFSPSNIVRRQIANWRGIKSDSIQVVRHEPFEYRYKADRHLLVLSERAERDQGETLVEGLPKSSQRQFNQKLTLVPAGHQFHGWQIPRTLARVTYFYIDPHRFPIDPELRFDEAELTPRLFFFDHDLWETLLKLKAQAENPDRARQGYAEALSLVLAHELVRLDRGIARTRQTMRGGLAARQKRRVADYIEEHLADGPSLSTLAQMADLSPFHFSRAFKESFGLPPHRYLTSRRIEKAKDLLAQSDISVTQIGLQLGFAETSSFSTAFHKHSGTTPTAYRRSLE
jgi:AraC family transcriptional regulator